MTQKTNPWTFDVRVRDRNLKAGTITDKDVDKYVAGLPDLTDHSEGFSAFQPALAPPPPAAVADVADVAGVAGDVGDDEDDDDDDEDEDEGEGEGEGEDNANALATPE